jgi:hypothetical protein
MGAWAQAQRLGSPLAGSQWSKSRKKSRVAIKKPEEYVSLRAITVQKLREAVDPMVPAPELVAAAAAVAQIKAESAKRDEKEKNAAEDAQRAAIMLAATGGRPSSSGSSKHGSSADGMLTDRSTKSNKLGHLGGQPTRSPSRQLRAGTPSSAFGGTPKNIGTPKGSVHGTPKNSARRSSSTLPDSAAGEGIQEVSMTESEELSKEHFHYEWHQKRRIHTHHTKLTRLGTCAVVPQKGVSDRRYFNGSDEQLWRVLQRGSREVPSRKQLGLIPPSTNTSAPEHAFDTAAEAFPSARQRWVEDYKRASAANPVEEYTPKCAFRAEGNTERNSSKALAAMHAAAAEAAAIAVTAAADVAAACVAADSAIQQAKEDLGIVFTPSADAAAVSPTVEGGDEDGKKRKGKKKEKKKSPMEVALGQLREEAAMQEEAAQTVKQRTDELVALAFTAQAEVDQMGELGVAVNKKRLREGMRARAQADIAIKAYESAQMKVFELQMDVRMIETDMREAANRKKDGGTGADGGRQISAGLTTIVRRRSSASGGMSSGWLKMQQLMQTQQMFKGNAADSPTVRYESAFEDEDSEDEESEDELSESEEEKPAKPKSMWSDSESSGSEDDDDDDGGGGGGGGGGGKKKKKKDDLDSSSEEDEEDAGDRQEYSGADTADAKVEEVVPTGMMARQQLHVTVDAARLRLGQLEGGVEPIVCPLSDEQRHTIWQLRERRGWKSGGKSGFRRTAGSKSVGSSNRSVGSSNGLVPSKSAFGQTTSSLGMSTLSRDTSTVGTASGVGGMETTMLGAGDGFEDEFEDAYEEESESEDDEEEAGPGGLASCVPDGLLLIPSNIEAVALSIGHSEVMVRSHASAFKTSLRVGYNPISTEVRGTQRQRLGIQRINAIKAEKEREEAEKLAVEELERAVKRRKWEQEQRRLGLFDEREKGADDAKPAADALDAANKPAQASLKKTSAEEEADRKAAAWKEKKYKRRVEPGMETAASKTFDIFGETQPAVKATKKPKPRKVDKIQQKQKQRKAAW